MIRLTSSVYAGGRGHRPWVAVCFYADRVAGRVAKAHLTQ